MSVSGEQSWVSCELGGAEFGDDRLRSRLLRITADLSSNPEAAINRASTDWSATKAAYRFFDNDKVTPTRILSPHREQTVARIKESTEYCLAIQDTTYLNLNGHQKCEGLGFIGTDRLKGHIAHTTLACSTDGLPLGILEQKLYTRGKIRRLSTDERKKLSISEKESIRWLESVRAIAAIADEQVTKKIVSVCDREGDIEDFLFEAGALKLGFLVRSSTSRKLSSPDIEQDLHETIKQAPIAGQTSLTLPSRGGKYAQQKVSIPANVQFLNVKLESNKKKLEPLQISVVRVTATNGKNSLEWILLTNIAVNNLEDAVERIRWYQLRWHIEIFHKILKSGCSIEAVRLNTVERLNRCITLYSIIAWRIFYLTHLQRVAAEGPATLVLSRPELNVLQKLLVGRNKIINVNTLRGATRAIATLGGYLNRNNDPEPGPIVIWRGFTQLQTVLLAASALLDEICG